MRLLSVTSVLLFLLIYVPSEPTQSKPHQPSDTTAHSGDSQKQERDSTATGQVVPEQVIVSQLNSDPNQNAEQGGFHKYSSHIDSFFTAVIAVFGVLTWRVYREMLRANKIAERAWVVPNIITPSLPGNEKDMPHGFQVICRIENNGRTPAWLTATGSRGQVIKAGAQLSPEPTYTWAGPFPPDGTVLPPKGCIEQGIPLEASVLPFIEAGTHVFYIYGAIKYRDIYKQKHETKYCFVFKTTPTADNSAPRDFYIAGPAGYNLAT